MFYLLAFLVPACLFFLQAYRLRGFPRRNKSYLPPEILNHQRQLLASRPLPPRKQFLWFLPLDRQRNTLSTPFTFTPGLQSKSSAFFALPAEIRCEIYRKLIGESRIHCATLVRSLDYFSCTEANPALCNCQDRVFGDSKHFSLWNNLQKLPEDIPKPSLEILRTCRQVYAEASDLFYTSNIFVIHSIWTPMDMTNVISPYRLSQIRSLNLNFSFGAHGMVPLMSPISRNPMHLPANDQKWVEAWKCLSTSFTGVQHLSLTLEMRSLDLFIDHPSDAWIEPLLEVVKMPLKTCTVTLRGWDKRFQTKTAQIPSLERKLESMLCPKVKAQL